MTFIADDDKRALVERYVGRFRKYGIDVETLKSGGPEKQRIRHTVHSAIGYLNNRRILDIGCGLADYYSFLIGKGLRIAYFGYDIVEPFIEVNKGRFPEATFRLHDVLTDGIVDEVDYVVMSQVFNNKYTLTGNEEVVRQAMAESFSSARIGVSIDMMTKYVEYEEETLYYFSPERMFGFAKSLTKFVVLRHDYLPYEFTLYLYKGQPAL